MGKALYILASIHKAGKRQDLNIQPCLTPLDPLPLIWLPMGTLCSLLSSPYLMI